MTTAGIVVVLLAGRRRGREEPAEPVMEIPLPDGAELPELPPDGRRATR